MAREDPHFRLRIPEGLLEKVQAAASEHKRSATAEIVDRLERSFEWEKLIHDYEHALVRLGEQERTEQDLRHTIQILEQKVEDFKAGLYVDMSNEGVQKAMISRMQEVMDDVIVNMREEQEITRGMPLLIRWFEANPDEKSDYDALSPEEQDTFVIEKTHELWIEHLNREREKRGSRKAATDKPRRLGANQVARLKGEKK